MEQSTRATAVNPLPDALPTEMFRRIVEEARDCVFVATPKRHILFINRVCETIFGYTPEDYLRDRDLPRQVIHPDNRDRFEAFWADYSRTHTFPTEPIEWTWIRRDGRVIVCEHHYANILDEQGQVCAYLAIIRDVTERKRIDEALRQSEERFRLAGAAVQGIVYDHDHQTGMVYRSQGLVEVVGFHPDEVPPTVEWWCSRIHPEDLTRIDLGKFGSRFQLEYRVQHRNGSYVHVFDCGLFLRDAAGQVARTIGCTVDVSARKEAEAALREREQRLRRMVEHLPAGAALIEGQHIFVNQGAEEITGYSRAEIASVDDWFHKLFPNRYQEMKARFEADRHNSWIHYPSVPITRKDGSGRLLELTGSAEDGTHVWLLRDVTDAERLARLMEQTARTANIGGWELDCRTMALFWSPGTFRLHETTPEAYVPEVQSAISFYSAESVPMITEAVRAGIERGEGWSLELDLITARGRSIHVLATGIAEQENGQTVRLYGSFQDITERKKAEQEKSALEQKLQETQKLESLGVLAGGIAHDFNNLLTVILGNVTLLRPEVQTGSSGDGCLGHIESAALRAADLCKQMLAYAGKGKFILKRVEIAEIIREIAGLFRLSISKKAVLDMQLAEKLPAVMADATQIRQILMNLILNASEALGDRPGRIEIVTGTVNLDATPIRDGFHGADLAPGRYVFIEVSDTGCGMSPQTRARIFDPFFTTKFTGRGLGLAAVLGIVRGHGGGLNVQSEPGKGTRFTLYLPAADDAQPTASTREDDAEQWRGMGTALIVDDEVGVRQVVARILRSAGLDSVEAADGRAGLEKFRANPEAYQLIILDLTMPFLGGDELLRQIRQSHPDLPVVVMSGYSEEQAVARLAGLTVSGHLQKPFRVGDLVKLLQGIPELAARSAPRRG